MTDEDYETVTAYKADCLDLNSSAAEGEWMECKLNSKVNDLLSLFYHEPNGMCDFD